VSPSIFLHVIQYHTSIFLHMSFSITLPNSCTCNSISHFHILSLVIQYHTSIFLHMSFNITPPYSCTCHSILHLHILAHVIQYHTSIFLHMSFNITLPYSCTCNSISHFHILARVIQYHTSIFLHMSFNITLPSDATQCQLLKTSFDKPKNYPLKVKSGGVKKTVENAIMRAGLTVRSKNLLNINQCEPTDSATFGFK
jgi:bacterioferritin-associated ferredoxin